MFGTLSTRSTKRIECIMYSICYQTVSGQVHHVVLGGEPGLMPTDLLAMRGIQSVGEVLFEHMGLSWTVR